MLLLAVLGLTAAASAALAFGTTWHQEKAPSGVERLVDVSCVPSGKQVHCVAVGSKGAVGHLGTGQVAVSRDGGQKWKGYTLGSGIQEIKHVSCSGPSFCMATGQQILTTTDGGVKWSKDPLNSSDLDSAQNNPIDCVGQDCWIAPVFEPDLLFTSDGGKQFTEQTLPCPSVCTSDDGYPSAVSFVSKTVGYASGTSACSQPKCPGYVWKTTDGGKQWNLIDTSLQTAIAISCTDATHCWVVANKGSNGLGAYQTSDGGAKWTFEHVPGAETQTATVTGISCEPIGGKDHCYAVGNFVNGKPFAYVDSTSDGVHWLRDKSPSANLVLDGVSLAAGDGQAVGVNDADTAPVITGS